MIGKDLRIPALSPAKKEKRLLKAKGILAPNENANCELNMENRHECLNHISVLQHEVEAPSLYLAGYQPFQ